MIERLLRAAELSADYLLDIPKYRRGDGPKPKIIAHRGAWDLHENYENTLKSFGRAQKAGAWGVEFDVHFTKDDVPVVHHDPGTARIFKQPGLIERMTAAELRARCPLLPTLAEVLALKGLHFMIEIKVPLGESRTEILNRHLRGLRAREDYHLLAIDPALVRESAATPKNAWILVGELMLKSRVELSLKNGYGGVAGHYLGLRARDIERLHAAGQKAGVGFVPTRNLLHREWARGVDFVFTNTIYRLS